MILDNILGPDPEDEAALDNHANLQNPDHDDYDEDYGSNSYDADEHEQYENDNRSNQMNPNNDAYYSSRK
ncbi:hypothetical protein [Mycoplasma todarodis]|uniref:hypothetical protein n=1 Tax=Mycoplasma todarodis TaxID=1937191 RepID=UPI003B3009C0